MRLYLDTVTKIDNPYHGQANGAHPIWLDFGNGRKRPATNTEIALWNQALEEAAQDLLVELEVDESIRQAAKSIVLAGQVYKP